MKPTRRITGKPALDLLEEAVVALKQSGALTLLCYYLGTVPLVLAFLYFWAEMSAGAYAEQKLSPEALGLAVAFIWMKCWQSVFAVRLLASIGAEQPPVWSPGRIWRLIVQQAAVQSTGFFLMPVATLLTLPAAWTYAFYQNFLLDGSGERQPLRVLAGRSIEQGNLWVRQNHVALSYLSVFGMVVFINYLTLIMATPFLLKTLLGIDTLFSRSGFHLFNTTVLMIAAGLTHLTVDPIGKTFYVLREFYGRSVHSGDDLKVALRRFRPVAAAVAACLVLGASAGWADAAQSGTGFQPNTVRIGDGPDDSGSMTVAPASWSAGSPLPLSQADQSCCPPEYGSATKVSVERSPVRSGEINPECASFSQALFQSGRGLPALQDAGAFLETPNGIQPQVRLKAPIQTVLTFQPASLSTLKPTPIPDSAALNRSIDSVLARPEYAWRAPRVVNKAADGEKPGIWATFANTVRDVLKAWLKPVRKWVRDILQWLDRYLTRQRANSQGNPGDWKGGLEILLYSLCAVIVGFAAYVGWRAWKQGRAAPVVTAQAVRAAPDLRNEEVFADELPEDRWLQLADEMAARGEFRLSMRALYLAALAHLGLRELITITRAKSNKEFRIELARRACTQPDLLAAFGDSVNAFERAWYGRDEVTRDIVARYLSTVRQIQQC